MIPAASATLAALAPLLRDEPALLGTFGKSAASLAVPEPARAVTIAALAALSKRRPVVVAVPTSAEAERLVGDLECYLGPDPVELFPAWETLPFERVSPSVETMGRRLRTLWRLQDVQRAPAVIVAPARALVQRLGPHVEDLQPITITPGATIDPQELVEALVAAGYRREYQVEHRGEVAVRGSIVDVFGSTADAPVRVDLWGDEVDRLTTFSVNDQRSDGDVASVELFACRELLATAEVRERAEALIDAEPWGRPQWERLADGELFDGMESWLPWLAPTERVLLDVVPAGRSRGRRRTPSPARSGERHHRRGGRPGADAVEHLGRLGGRRLAAPAPRSRSAVGAHHLAGLDDGHGGGRPRGRHRQSRPRGTRPRVTATASSPSFDNSPRTATASWSAASPRPRPSASTSSWATTACRIGCRHDGGVALTEPGGSITVAPIHRGFILPSVKLAVLAEADVTGRRRTHRRPRPRKRQAQAFFDDLTVGSYVVHHHHGVARFGGMVKRTIGGTDRDYLLLEYRGDDRLYVPSDQIDAVRPYSGGDSPSLSKMGGSDFARSKARVRAEVEEVAQELVVLYQKRLHAPGHAFGADTPWQRELEDSFVFEETPDQLQAIIDTKADMESERPMDRLIIGDVGFGKTEVALRAAFKAVQDGRQVAVLVPTTLLAQQHFADLLRTVRPLSGARRGVVAVLDRGAGPQGGEGTVRRRGRCGDRHAPALER